MLKGDPENRLLQAYALLYSFDIATVKEVLLFSVEFGSELLAVEILAVMMNNNADNRVLSFILLDLCIRYLGNQNRIISNLF